MDLEKDVGGSEPHNMIICSGLSISPPLLVTNDQGVNSGAQKGIVRRPDDEDLDDIGHAPTLSGPEVQADATTSSEFDVCSGT